MIVSEIEAETYPELLRLFHRCWKDAKLSDRYNKKDWILLECEMLSLMKKVRVDYHIPKGLYFTRKEEK